MECPVCRADISPEDAAVIKNYHGGMEITLYCKSCDGYQVKFLYTEDFEVI